MVNKLEDRYSWEEIAERFCIQAQVPQKNQEDFKAWFLSKQALGVRFDAITYHRAYNTQRSLKDDYDHFTVICGSEGSGKSTFAANYCAVVSPTFCMKNVCFVKNDLLQALETAKRGDSLILDEGALFLFSRESMSLDNRIVTKLFTLFRQLNLHVCICMPNFWMIDSFIRDHRVKTLFRIPKRGDLTLYAEQAIRILSKEGAKYKGFDGIKLPYGTFTMGYYNAGMPNINDFNDDNYRKFKAETLQAFIKEIKQGTENVSQDLFDVKYVSKKMGISEAAIRERLRDGQIKAKKVGSSWFVGKEELERLIKGEENMKGEGRVGKLIYLPTGRE